MSAGKAKATIANTPDIAAPKTNALLICSRSIAGAYSTDCRCGHPLIPADRVGGPAFAASALVSKLVRRERCPYIRGPERLERRRDAIDAFPAKSDGHYRTSVLHPFRCGDRGHGSGRFDPWQIDESRDSVLRGAVHHEVRRRAAGRRELGRVPA